MAPFGNFIVVLIIFNYFPNNFCDNHLWHSHYDLIHQNREELVISKVRSGDAFELNFKVDRFKSLSIGKFSYVVGSDRSLLVLTILGQQSNSFTNKSSILDLQSKINDFVLFQRWNSIKNQDEVILIVATEHQELLWFKIENLTPMKFWSWPLQKNLSHINYFQIDFDDHLLVITNYLNRTTGDLYEFNLVNQPNFWLRQSIQLYNTTKSSALTNFGPNYFLSIPQKSLNSLLIYKLIKDRFVPYKNLTSDYIDDVVSFEINSKSFIAFNGYQAGIYRFVKNDLIKEDLFDSHFLGIMYWLPISLNNRDNIALLAQRWLDHTYHFSFLVEVIVYNGVKFEEHEDISCLYFGETFDTLGCLTENNRRGIRGAASIRIGDNTGLLLPSDNTSEFFVFETEMRKTPNPVEVELKTFQETQKRLDNLLNTQLAEFEKVLNSQSNNTEIRNSQSKNIDENPDLEFLKIQVDNLETKVNKIEDRIKEIEINENQAFYDTIIFNGLVEIRSDCYAETVTTEKLNGEPTDAIFSDIVRRNSTERIFGDKSFSTLTINRLLLDEINNISAEKLIFSKNGTLEFSGNLTIQEAMIVEDQATIQSVNGLIFENEITEINWSPHLELDNVVVLKSFETENLNNIPVNADLNVSNFDKSINWSDCKLDMLYIPENIEVVNVNGDNFQEFLKQLCLTNIETYIPENILINGDVKIEGNSTIDYLNNLKFPDGLLFTDDATSKITGQKTFSNKLKIHEMHCNGFLDNIDPDEIITLTTRQTITGKTTFENLEISEHLNIFGNVNGLDASNLLKRPTLAEFNKIQSRVNFKKLEINGSIIITNDFNGHNFSELLENVVYSDEHEVQITAIKEFPKGFTVHNNLNLDSNSISHINLNSLVTKTSKQELNFDKINGNVTIANLLLNGLYNSIDIKKLDDETVKLTGDQYISSTLIFNENIEVNQLDIIETINANSLEALQMENQEIEIPLKLDNLTVEILEIRGDLSGNFTNFDLIALDERRLSLSKDQRISGNYSIGKSQISEIYPEKINGFGKFEMTDQELLETKIIDRLARGKIQIKNVHVNGSLKIDEINGDILMNLGGILFEEGLQHYQNLTFKDNVTFDKLTINQYKNRNFNEIIDNLIYKNETRPTIKGLKWFNRGIVIEKLLETQKINEIPIYLILTKHGNQTVQGPIEITGDVTISNDLTIDKINNIPIDLITKNYEKTGDTYRINGDVIFNRLAHIENLQINNNIDNKNVDEYLDSIALIGGDFEITNEIIFENQVKIAGNLTVENTINGVNLTNFLSNIVTITDANSLQIPIRFIDPVIVDRFQLSGNIETDLINNIRLDELLKQAIFVDQGLLKGNYSLESAEIVGNLNTDFINKINTNRLIPLKIDQNLTGLSFNKLISLNNIEVNESVNGLDLLEEFQNTLLKDVDQEITTNLLFKGDLTITKNLTIDQTLNNKNIDRIVTTNTDQNLNASYNFVTKQIIDKNLNIDGCINEINLTNWQERRLKIYSNDTQIIYDNWNLSRDLIFENGATGGVEINGFNLENLQKDVDKKRRFKYKIEKKFIATYREICDNLTVSHRKAEEQMYKFDYLDRLQSFSFKKPINYIYSFQFGEVHFLLVNEIGSCVSHLLRWNNFEYLPVDDFYLGEILQIITVKSGNSIFLVVRNFQLSECQIEGTNIWGFDTSNYFKRILVMENQHLLQESAIPGTFYGIKNGIVSEFFIVTTIDPVLRKIRKWEIFEDNMAFVPRDLKTGPAIRTGRKLIRLNRDDDLFIDNDLNTEIIINANFTKESNTNFPGYNNNDLVVVRIVSKMNKRNLLAIVTQEDTLIKSGSYDIIEIYENPIQGKLFQKIPTFQPSSLISIEFNNGETLLAFLEDETVLQIYEYKGIEGFKHRTSVRINGSKLFTLIVPKRNDDGSNGRRFIIGVIDRNRLHLIEARMLGNQLDGHLDCLL